MVVRPPRPDTQPTQQLLESVDTMRKLQHQATSGASMRSRAFSPRPSDAAASSRGSWWGRDALLLLANSYYASRMVLVTLASCLSLVLLCVFAVSSPGFWIWVAFQVTNILLGVSALPTVFLYSVVSARDSEDEPQDDEEETDPSPDAAAAPPSSQRRKRDRVTSFSFLRSSFHDIETKLEPFTLKRSSVLRLCETIVVVQTVLAVFVVVAVISEIWNSRDSLWRSFVFTSGTGSAVIAMLCVYLQTQEFDRLRAHEQLQLGVGLDQDQLDQVRSSSKRRPGSSGRISAVFDPSASLRSHLSDAQSVPSERISLDLGHAANVVDKELRRGLYEAAVNRDKDKARKLLNVMERALGSKIKVELLLLRMYATPMLWLWTFAFTTHNPLHVACRLGDEGMVEVLLEGGMNPNLLDKTQGEPLTLRVMYDVCQGRPRNITNVLGSPLHVAVTHGHSHLIEVLVRYGANIDLVAQTSFISKAMRVPPIFLADSAEVIESLIRHRANFLVVPGKGNSKCITVLQRAQLDDRSELSSVLKDWGADVALTPLHEAAAAGDVATVKNYLSLGIPPDQLGEFQDGVHRRTPLHWASIMGRRTVVTELLKCGADVNALDVRMRSPLHWAARHCHVEAMRELLLNGADPHLCDDEGLTPMAFSAVGGLLNGECVKLFMEYGVDINERVPNQFGDTCLHLALRTECYEAALALIQSGNADLASYNSLGEPAIKCCASAEQLFAIKTSSNWTDIVISYDSAYRELADHLKGGIEESYLTAFMRDANDDAVESMHVMREASALVCVLTPGFEHNAICMEELAYAKVIRVPVMAITIESMNLPEELQVYLFTRQLVPFREAIITSRRRSTVAGPSSPVDTREFRFKLDDEKFKRSLQNLIDGLRDEVELHDLGATRLGDPDELDGDVINSSRYLPRPGTESVRPSVATSDAPSQVPELERGSSTTALVRSSAVSMRSSTRSSTAKRRTLNDVVKDVLSRRRRPTVHPLLGVNALAMTSVFLSHGDCHTEFVNKLYEELKKNEVPVTLDTMAHVSSMKDRILAAKDAILQCNIFLVVLSEKSVKTELVSDQLAFAEDKGKYIVPIYYTRRPSLIDTTVRKLLEETENKLIIFGNGISYGRGFDKLLRELRQEHELLQLEEAEKEAGEWVSVSPAARSAVDALLEQSRVRSRSANRSILV